MQLRMGWEEEQVLLPAAAAVVVAVASAAAAVVVVMEPLAQGGSVQEGRLEECSTQEPAQEGPPGEVDELAVADAAPESAGEIGGIAEFAGRDAVDSACHSQIGPGRAWCDRRDSPSPEPLRLGPFEAVKDKDRNKKKKNQQVLIGEQNDTQMQHTFGLYWVMRSNRAGSLSAGSCGIKPPSC
jgi:hypothetical protein